jgi:hypothetical protein
MASDLLCSWSGNPARLTKPSRQSSSGGARNAVFALVADDLTISILK